MTREEYLLNKLSEECGEVVQMVSKVKNFGRDEVYKIQEFTNAERLAIETRDLLNIVNMLIAEGFLDGNIVFDMNAMSDKQVVVDEYYEVVLKLKGLNSDGTRLDGCDGKAT